MSHTTIEQFICDHCGARTTSLMAYDGWAYVSDGAGLMFDACTKPECLDHARKLAKDNHAQYFGPKAVDHA